MRSVDIYWLAGLLEGEGNFSFVPHTDNPKWGSIRLTLGMSDRDVVERAQSLLGGNIRAVDPNRYHKDGHARKEMYYLTVHGARAAGWMMTLYSLLGNRRQAAIQEVLARWKQTKGRGWNFARHDDKPFVTPQAA